MLGVKHERGVHGFDLRGAGRSLMEEMEKVSTDGVVIRADLDAASVPRKMIPIEQYRIERGEQAVGDLARSGGVMALFFRLGTAQRGNARAQDVHRMRGGRQGFQHGLDGGVQAAQRLEFRFVSGEFGFGGKPAMHQQMRDFLEFAMRGQVENIVAEIVEVVAAASDGAERGVAGDNAGKRDGFFRLEGRDGFRAHEFFLVLEKSSSSFCS